jgi:hypothetical protein
LNEKLAHPSTILRNLRGDLSFQTIAAIVTAFDEMCYGGQLGPIKASFETQISLEIGEG